MRSLCGSKKWLAAVLPVSMLLTFASAASAASFAVTTTSLPNGVDGVAFLAQLTSANGTGKVTWVLASGSSLEKGLTLSTAGKISGTPTSSTNGAGNFKVTAKDSASPAHTATATVAYIINPEDGSFRITTTSFPNGTVGIAYSSSIKSSGGTGKVTFKLIDSTKLPAGLSLSAAGAITGKPTATSSGKDFWVEATDSSTPTAKTVKAYLGVLVEPALKITANLPAGIAGSPYGGTINVEGGAAKYSWTVNGTLVPISGSQVALGDGLNIFTCTGGNLCIGGSPSAAAKVSFKVSVKDTAGAIGGPDAYSITINPASSGTLVTGQIDNLNNWCGSGTVPSYPPITVTLGTTPVRTTTADIHSGEFSFSDVPAGTYTLTPSISIAGASSLFFPASEKVAVAGSSQKAGNFTFSVGYTVSGTANYAGSKTGRIYLTLNGNNCGGTTPGISIPAKGAFSIRGVAPGNYTLQAWMDNLGYGAPNAANPSGSSPVKVSTTANLNGANVTLVDPGAITLSTAPQLQGVAGFNQGAMAQFSAIQNNNGVEIASSYKLEWSTTETFTAVTGSKVFPPTGSNGSGIWFVNGLSNGAVYYFRAQGVAGSSTSAWSSVVGPVTIESPTDGNTVSGTVSFTGEATGPLYTGFYDQKTGDVYLTQLGSEASPPTSPAAYSVKVPSGTGYFHFAVVDQKNLGAVVTGDIQNVNGGGKSSGLTISTPLTNEDVTLPGGNASVSLTSSHYQQVNQHGTADGYSLNFSVNGEIKQPAAVTLASGPNALTPADLGECNNCGGSGFDFYLSLNTDIPKVGDSYGLLVTYTDGTTQTLTAKVGAVLTAFATDLSPTGTGGSTTPTFKWTDPADASSYTYSFNLWDADGNQIWQIPNHDSGAGFPSTITSITWGTDPTGANNSPSVSALTNGQNYNWQLQVQDSNGNSTQMQVSYEPNN
jgi:hypothetical protein